MLSRKSPRGQIVEYTGDQRGITLVEILVAVVLLSLVSTIFLNLLVTAMGWNELAADKTRATNYAASVMEELRTVSSDFSVLCGYTYSYDQGNWDELGLSLPAMEEKMKAEVAIQADDEAAGLFGIKVLVEWGHRGKQREVVLESMIWGSS
ncbi:MAG: prepilin-type N-terminal cleavage/methylation domain-containing protein [Syntrophomonadaceae bacterium]|nr:prepilin-type N-terminal cleavage/methylation domain-containing protein [Syntrophomonadaceae bacterium]